MSNSIVKPGYHIRPKYDLSGLRRKRTSHSSGHVAGELPLTSMIDMFSILVIYLLMNFSASGDIFFVQKKVTLPHAENSRPLASAPIVSVIGDIVSLDAEQVGQNPLSIEEKDANLPRLTSALTALKDQMKQEHPGEEFAGRLNVQAGEETPLVYIKRAMQACVAAGWTNINFVVDNTDHQPGGASGGASGSEKIKK